MKVKAQKCVSYYTQNGKLLTSKPIGNPMMIDPDKLDRTQFKGRHEAALVAPTLNFAGDDKVESDLKTARPDLAMHQDLPIVRQPKITDNVTSVRVRKNKQTPLVAPALKF